MSHPVHSVSRKSLAGTMELDLGIFAQKCYQCGKCSAGCPLSYEMDYPPSMVLRLLQTENDANDEKLLRSTSIWLCVSCEMCLTRCPYEIDIPSMMDFMRQRSLAQKKANPAARNIIAFHRSFLNSVKNTGRLYELGMTIDYKRKSLNLLQDVALAPKMFARGKLHILPEKIKNTAALKKIFQKTLDK